MQESCDTTNDSLVRIMLNSALINSADKSSDKNLEERADGGSQQILLELNPHNPDLLELLREWDLEGHYQHLHCTYKVSVYVQPNILIFVFFSRKNNSWNTENYKASPRRAAFKKILHGDTNLVWKSHPVSFTKRQQHQL